MKLKIVSNLIKSFQRFSLNQNENVAQILKEIFFLSFWLFIIRGKMCINMTAEHFSVNQIDNSEAKIH